MEDQPDRHDVEQRKSQKPRRPVAGDPVGHVADEASEDADSNRKYPPSSSQQLQCEHELQNTVYEQPDRNEAARRLRQSLRTMADEMNRVALRMQLQLGRSDPYHELVKAFRSGKRDNRAGNSFDGAVNALDDYGGNEGEAQSRRSSGQLIRPPPRPRGSPTAGLARSSRRRAAVCAMSLYAFAAGAQADPQTAGSLSETRFAEYSSLSSNAELARRLLSPLSAAQLSAILARTAARLSAQPVNLAQETFAVYVPAREPPQGYGLVVFVPPWNALRLPDGWGPVLDENGAIFVSAIRSGNDQSVVGRRVPLAILGEQNVVRRYPIDPRRIYVAGFSGGSRVALRLALAYPDLFRGAILNAGSDPIGTASIPLPPKDLLFQFQQFSHLIYVTGDRDSFHVAKDFSSMHSLRDWCVFGVEDHPTAWSDHEVINPEALSRALDGLSKPEPADANQLAACRAGIDAELENRLRQVQAFITAGNRESASDLLKDIDTRFGGLAAPDSVTLSADIDKIAAKQ